MPASQNRTLARRRMYRRRRQVVGGGLLLVVMLLVLGGFKVAAILPTGQVSQAGGSARAALQTMGSYARAPGGTDRSGSGTPITYRVEVETRMGQGPRVFAAAVDATLVSPSGWIGTERWSFQRVDRDDVSFVIRLATPDTVDKVCATAGLDTGGYVSCRAGRFVMINLDRWLRGVPEYLGDVALYRHYVINHEVGHQLGYGHQSCPAPGRLAPVMQQQTLGLKGCLPNGWPLVNGALVSGPAAA